MYISVSKCRPKSANFSAGEKAQTQPVHVDADDVVGDFNGKEMRRFCFILFLVVKCDSSGLGRSFPNEKS